MPDPKTPAYGAHTPVLSADLREWIQGELADLCTRLAWPSPPSAAAFVQAEADTDALNAAARDASKPASAVALSLAQGVAAHSDTALLHVVYESSAAKGVLASAYDMRAQIHAETGGAGKARPASAGATPSTPGATTNRDKFDPLQIPVPAHLA